VVSYARLEAIAPSQALSSQGELGGGGEVGRDISSMAGLSFSRLHLQSPWSLRISGNSTEPKVDMHFLLVRKHQPPYSLLLGF